MKSLTNYINESNEKMSKDEFVNAFIEKWKGVFDKFRKRLSSSHNVSVEILSPRTFFEYDGSNIEKFAEDAYNSIVDPFVGPNLSQVNIYINISVKDGADKEMKQNFCDYANDIFYLDPEEEYDSGDTIRDEQDYMFMLYYPNEFEDFAKNITIIDNILSNPKTPYKRKNSFKSVRELEK